MKRFLITLTLIASLMLITSCGGGDGGETPTPTEHTVTFDGSGGTEYEPVTVGHGEKVARPFYPSKTGYSFDGWYQDAALTKPFDFSTNLITKNTVIYAKWS